MSAEPRFSVRGLDDLEAALAAVEDHKVPVPLATRLAVDGLVRTQSTWSTFELTEGLTGLLARTAAETEVVRRVLQAAVKPLAEASAAPLPNAAMVSPPPKTDAPPVEPTDAQPPGPSPSDPAGTPSALPPSKVTSRYLGSAPVAIPVVAVMAVIALIKLDPWPPPSDIVPSPAGSCPPPEVKAACPTRALVARGSYIRMAGSSPERTYPERPAGVVAAVAAMLLGALLARAWWAGRVRPPEKLPPMVDGMDAVTMASPSWPPLFTPDERVRLSWGAGRMLAEDDAPHLDVPATIGATIAKAGLFTPRQRRARRERAVWILDDVGDGSMLRAPLVEQWVAEFATVGVPYRRWRIRGDTLVDTVGGESVTWDELEDLARSASVVMVSAATTWLIDGEVRSRVAPRLSALSALRRLAWVDPDGRGVATALSDLNITVISPAALPRWLSSGVVATRPPPPLAIIELWAGLLLRYRCVPAVTPPLAAALAADLGLDEVRGLDLPVLWRLSSSASFVVAPKTAERLRDEARRKHPRLWARAGDWYRQRYIEYRRTQRGVAGWSGSRAETHIEAMLALMTIEDASVPAAQLDETALLAAVNMLHRAPSVHISVKWHARGQKSMKARQAWPARARRMLGMIDGSVPPDPSPPSLAMRGGASLCMGVMVAALLAYSALADPPPPPSTQVPVEFVNIPGGRGCLGSAACQRPTADELKASGVLEGEVQGWLDHMSRSEGIRTVFVSSFAVARTETTRAVFEAWRSGGTDLAKVPPASPDDHPVVQVTWDEARAFCRSLGEGFRSPNGSAVGIRSARGGYDEISIRR